MCFVLSACLPVCLSGWLSGWLSVTASSSSVCPSFVFLVVGNAHGRWGDLLTAAWDGSAARTNARATAVRTRTATSGNGPMIR
eukprot:COSAG02_NODE_1025_length_15146_cov_21.959460_9_plen_83_part_00